MLTRNYYSLLGAMLESGATYRGMTPCTDVYGMQYFVGNQPSGFPYSRTETWSNGLYTAGISIGRGTTPPKLSDFNLEDTITSGVTASILNVFNIQDSDGTPYKEYTLTVTNNTGADLAVSEIGYKQLFKSTRWRLGGGNEDIICLIDRTVFEPVTIANKATGVFTYRLMSKDKPKTVNGVKIVSWQNGTDEDVAAMIDAARLGTIDLQTDGGWCRGDMRTINIGSFTAGGATKRAEQYDIIITSFEEYYEGAGNVLQFDFVNGSTDKMRMNPTNTNVDGYGEAEVFTSLANMADAMEDWIKTRLITFNVLASEGNNSATIRTIPDNKLALRSEYEVYGTSTNSYPGEGTKQLDYFREHVVAKKRQRRLGRTGANTWMFFRSPAKNATQFVGSKADGSAIENGNASSLVNICPFGLL